MTIIDFLAATQGWSPAPMRGPREDGGSVPFREGRPASMWNGQRR